MKNFIKNKKAVSEIVSFVLLTLLIVTASTTAYIFSKEVIDKNIAQNDLMNTKKNIKILLEKINKYKNFDQTSFAHKLEFSKGILKLENNQILYYSLNEYNGNNYCFENLCYKNNQGFEVVYANISSSYMFKNNITLSPQDYTLMFTNIKNESKISILLK